MTTRSGRSSTSRLSGTMGMRAAGHVLGLLRRVPVHDIGDEIRLDAAEVEKRVALGRCAVGADLVSLALRLDQERQGVVLDSLGPPLERTIKIGAPHARRLFFSDERRNGRFDGSRSAVPPLREDSEAAAVRGQLLNIEDGKTIFGEDLRDGGEREVGIVLVIGRIELIVSRHFKR